MHSPNNPTAENPLVIDLPDGQKLVIGQLADGSIIEIATWRGTGRPDSRTSRLMLGMANGAPVQRTQGEDYEKQGEQKVKSPAEFLNQVKSNFSGLVSRFGGASEAEKMVQEEIFAPSAARKATGKQESKSEDPEGDSIKQIRKTGSEVLSRMRKENKSRRGFGGWKHDPVAEEVDLWLQKVLRDAQARSERNGAHKKSAPKKSAPKTRKATSKISKAKNRHLPAHKLEKTLQHP
jgi:hypothetical protein